MGRVTIVDSMYKEEIDVINAVNYILDREKCRHQLYGSNNIIATDLLYFPDSVARQLLIIQRTSTISFQRRIFHIGIDFDNDLDHISQSSVLATGYLMMGLYPRYQAVFSVHENTKNIHLHLIINNIPLYGAEPLTKHMNLLRLEDVDKAVQDACYSLMLSKDLHTASCRTICHEVLSRFLR